jgi:hypothetical protein
MARKKAAAAVSEHNCSFVMSFESFFDGVSKGVTTHVQKDLSRKDLVELQGAMVDGVFVNGLMALGKAKAGL